MKLDMFIDTFVELIKCFNTCSILNKVCIMFVVIVAIIVSYFAIVATAKLAFEILQIALTILIVSIVIYFIIRILIWFAENV